MALDPKQLFDIQSEFIPLAETARFGKTIFITTDDTLDGGPNRARQFISYNEALRFFEQTGPLMGVTGEQVAVQPKKHPTRAVQAYYKQQKNNPITVVRYFNTAQDSVLTGGSAPDLAAIKTSGTSDNVVFEGGTYSIDFTGAADLAAVASALQTEFVKTAALGAGKGTRHQNLGSVTVAYVSNINRFVITVTQANAALHGEITGFFGGASSSALGLDTGTHRISHAVETIEQTLTELETMDVEYDFITIEEGLQEGIVATALAEWSSTQENKKIFLEFYNPSSTIAAGTTSPLHVLAETDNNKLVFIFDKTATRDYKSVGLASEYAGVDYFGLDTLPDGKWIFLRGFRPTQLTEEEARQLRERKCNFFTKYGRYRLLSEGVTGRSGEWLDASIWADWFGTATYDAFFALFLGNNRIPATARGLARIETALLPALQAGVRNGGAAPGTFPDDTIAEIRQATQNPNYNGVTRTGWFIYIQPLSQRSPSATRNRRAPTVYIWVNGSGSFHFASVRAILREGGSELTIMSDDEEAGAEAEAA